MTSNNRYVFFFQDPTYRIYFATTADGEINPACCRGKTLEELALRSSIDVFTFHTPLPEVIKCTRAKLGPAQSIHPITTQQLEELLKYQRHFLLNAQPITSPTPNA